MSRVSSLSFVVAFIFLSACSGATATAIPTPSLDREKTEEQAVYAAALKSLYNATNYVIMDTSATNIGGSEDTSRTLEFVLQNIHDVDSESVENFTTVNTPGSPIQTGMQIEAEYTLLSQYTLSQIFSQNQSGWEIFYNHYPHTPGMTTLSHAGFNSTYDQALVYIGTQSNWLAGAGYYLLMKKVEDNWMVDQQVMVWIS
jgi:hypothetical protein